MQQIRAIISRNNPRIFKDDINLRTNNGNRAKNRGTKPKHANKGNSTKQHKPRKEMSTKRHKHNSGKRVRFII